jgi:ABC-type multidrug transport system fused ATPase/permease subunit
MLKNDAAADVVAAENATSSSIRGDSSFRQPPLVDTPAEESFDRPSAARTSKSSTSLPKLSGVSSSSLYSVADVNDASAYAAMEPSSPPPWYPTRNKALPDIDDLSVTQVFSYMRHYKTDLFWSFLSDSFFIAGSIAYIVISMWDFLSQGSVETEGPLRNKWYILLDVLAPLVYLFNSIVDIEWATHVHQRLMDKHKLTRHWEETAASYATLQQHAAQAEESSSATNAEDNEGSSFLNCGIPWGVPLWCRRLRKHAAHRRTALAAFMFGIAASLAVIAAVVRTWLDYHPLVQTFSIDAKLDMVSDHIYLVSAVISLTGKRNRPWLAPGPMALGTNIWSDPERLEDLGDLLFFIGCVLDAALADARLTELLYLAVLSSFLWFLDGCLYMHSDVVKATQLQKTQAEGVDVTIAIV